MSRRRRRPGKFNGNGGNDNNANPKAGKGGAPDEFWADPVEAPTADEPIRPTPDPAAVPRSLGDPPLTPDALAQHHLAVVYEEAVRAATALAAANGLLADDTDAG